MVKAGLDDLTEEMICSLAVDRSWRATDKLILVEVIHIPTRARRTCRCPRPSRLNVAMAMIIGALLFVIYLMSIRCFGE
jgi:hypothetical protein